MNILTNKAARELILTIFNAGLDEQVFTKVSPEALDNLNAFIHTQLAKASVKARERAKKKGRGSVIKLEELVVPAVKPKIHKRTVSEMVSDVEQGYLSVVEKLSSRVRELERGYSYLYSRLGTYGRTDNLTVKELGILTEPDPNEKYRLLRERKKR
tara:strand:+ start:412 stop:879 length:468 start_codon:yes stop_codon:yes gene_type:complete